MIWQLVLLEHKLVSNRKPCFNQRWWVLWFCLSVAGLPVGL